jgi:uroporphyrin-III C-methyltransferase/precorrin-2 dehydrogenase/sirohydrochlorin ferrochelatase
MSTDTRIPIETRLGQMEPLARLPVFFALAGRRVVLVGGSDAAAWKAELLSAAGAVVEVFAAQPAATLRAIAEKPPQGAVLIHERAWTSADLEGAAMAVGSFEDEAEASAFSSAARAAGVVVNVVDRPALCDFAFGAIVNRSPLVIGISTDGAAPNLAQWLRAKVEAAIPRGLQKWAQAAKAWRPAIQAASESFHVRRRLWERFTAQAVTHPDHEPRDADLQALLASVEAEQSAAAQGEVTLVGAGPGNPDFLTLGAVRALQSADIVLYDDLVSREILEFARREAKTMLVGKSGHGPSCKQEDINALMVSLARQGRRVVRLKGGDPTIFGRAGEEVDACRAAGVRVCLVPGITAAQGAAAALAVPLTHRERAQRVQFITGHGRQGGLPPDLDYAALADPRATTCIYMGRKTVSTLARRLITEGLPAETPAVAVSNASRPDQSIRRYNLGALSEEDALKTMTSPLMVMIGDVFADNAVQTAPGRIAHPAV